MLAMRAPPPAATARQAPPSTAAAFAVQRRRRPLRSPCTAVSARCPRCTPPSAAIAFAMIYSAGSSRCLQCSQGNAAIGGRCLRHATPPATFSRRELPSAPAILAVHTAIGGHRPCAMVNSTGTSTTIGGYCPRHVPSLSIACAMRRRPRPGRDARRRLGPRPCAFPDECQPESALKKDRGRDRSAQSSHPR